MAKKAKQTESVTHVENVEVAVTPVVEQPQARERKQSNEWELKDRLYTMLNGRRPLTHMMKGSGIYWFDEEKGYERELKYCQNQKTVFVDEMKGEQRLDHIIFRDGALFIPKEKSVLQKLLSLYHPLRGIIYEEYKPQQIAATQMEQLEMEVDAVVAARNIDIDMAEAIMRAEVGSKVSELSSKELRRDLLLFARKNSKLFLELADDDNVMLRNFGIKAVEGGILRLSSDQRNFLWGSNGRKIMTIPYDEHPYSALASWFKTDEGMEVYSNIEKRLNN
tara:strand:- start:188 stop:1021 length:834 start_codon:yes stop_codon:yes gene_type:complete